ncbi:MAG: tetratricopeptide repeat protein [Planctomycetota bacterium]
MNAILLVLACLASIGGVVAGALLLIPRGSAQPSFTLEMALDALDRGALLEAQELAKQMQAEGLVPPEHLGGPDFVLGAVAAYESRELLDKAAKLRYLVAARYLEESHNRGFPVGREAEGLYLLGRSLFHSGQSAGCLPVLQESLTLNPKRAAEIRWMLAAAYLSDANPKLDDALAQNTAMLAERRLTPEMRAEGLMQRAEILLRMGRLPECRKSLDDLPPVAQTMAEAVVLRGQLLIREAEQLAAQGESSKEAAAEKYREAIGLLRKVEGRDTLRAQSTSKAMYLTALCLEGSGDDRAALAQLSRTTKLYPATPDATACDFRESEIFRRLGKEPEAVAALQRALNSIVSAESFQNPWLSLDEVRTTAIKTYQQLVADRKYDLASMVARSTTGAFGAARSVELTAEVHEAWAGALAAEAEKMSPDRAEEQKRLARAKYREAGLLFRKLAALQSVTRQYTDYLWYSASCFHHGQDYRNSARMLREYLKNESRQRHAQALVLLGEAMLAMQRVDEALRAFQECIEFHPRDAAAYRARYLASRAWIEKGELERAEGLLRDNVSGEYLTPASREWRDSLFALGETLHLQGRYADAVIRLDEAVNRYPDAPQALQARYLLADSYRQMGRIAQDKLRQSLAGRADLALTPEIQRLYQQAIDRYRELQEILSRRQEQEELDPLDKELLKNSVFAVGAIQMDLEQYDQAIRTYLVAATRYQNSPEALDAYLEVAKAYRRIGKRTEARSTIEQAKVVLSRMKPDYDFLETTNFTRGQWAEVLDAQSQL